MVSSLLDSCWPPRRNVLLFDTAGMHGTLADRVLILLNIKFVSDTVYIYTVVIPLFRFFLFVALLRNVSTRLNNER